MNTPGFSNFIPKFLSHRTQIPKAHRSSASFLRCLRGSARAHEPQQGEAIQNDSDLGPPGANGQSIDFREQNHMVNIKSQNIPNINGVVMLGCSLIITIYIIYNRHWSNFEILWYWPTPIFKDLSCHPDMQPLLALLLAVRAQEPCDTSCKSSRNREP